MDENKEIDIEKWYNESIFFREWLKLARDRVDANLLDELIIPEINEKEQIY